jgi:Trypsin-like peptidase domain
MRRATGGHFLIGRVACLLLVAGAPRAFAAEQLAPDIAPIRVGQRNRNAATLLHDVVRDPAVRAQAKPVRLGVFDRAAALAFDQQRDQLPGTPLRIGENRPLPGGKIINVRNSGTWLTTTSGSRVWSLQFEVPDAQAVQVHFKSLTLPEGTQLLVTGTRGFVPDVLRGTGRMRNGGFWSTAVPGSVVYLEYQDPTRLAGNPTIVIDKITHIYRGFEDQNASNGSVANGTCEQDVMCFNTDIDARDSVARITFTDPDQLGTFVCSGALLVDNDPNTFAGYFLTANHCISTPEGAASLTAYWFYQANTCNDSVPSWASVPRSDGATLLVTSDSFAGGTDSTLLRLNNDPSDGQTFAAITTTAPPNNATVRGIHHPHGTFKRYSEGITTLQSPICSAGKRPLPTTRYIYNDWTLGQTEPGSSGSPLFDENWRVVGQLFGFCSFAGVEPGCDNQSGYNNVYGKMSIFFNQISSLILGVIPDDAFEDNDSLGQAQPITPAKHNLRLVDFDDFFSLTVSVPSVVTAGASFSTSDMDLNLQLLATDGTVLSSSATLGRFESVSSVVMPGTYIVHASKDAGWGGDYSLTITAVQKGCNPPPPPVAIVGDIDKNRFISFAPGDNTENVAYAVTLVTVHDPQPANLPQYPATDMSWLDGATRWVGAPVPYRVSLLPDVLGFASETSCNAVTMDWASYPQVHLFGPEIVPSSTYEIRAIGEGCDPALSWNFSAPLVLTTARWGDVIAPFQDTLATELTQPSVADIAAMLDAAAEIFGAESRLRTQLRTTADQLPRAPGVADITLAADAATGLAYPFGNISDCP